MFLLVQFTAVQFSVDIYACVQLLRCGSPLQSRALEVSLGCQLVTAKAPVAIDHQSDVKVVSVHSPFFRTADHGLIIGAMEGTIQVVGSSATVPPSDGQIITSLDVLSPSKKDSIITHCIDISVHCSLTISNGDSPSEPSVRVKLHLVNTHITPLKDDHPISPPPTVSKSPILYLRSRTAPQLDDYVLLSVLGTGTYGKV